MPSPFHNGAENANTLLDAISNGELVLGSGTLTTTDAAIGVAHGLSSAPDFVLVSNSVANTEGHVGFTAGATTITFTKADTGATETFSYIAGVLA